MVQHRALHQISAAREIAHRSGGSRGEISALGVAGASERVRKWAASFAPHDARYARSADRCAEGNKHSLSLSPHHRRRCHRDTQRTPLDGPL